MKREIIAIDGNGRVAMPTGCDRVRMTEMELAELFGVLVPTIRAAISALYKSGIVRESETTQCIRLPSGNYADTYNLETILALAFRMNSHHAAIIRRWLLHVATTQSRATAPIMIPITHGKLC
ncbi:hypothetical protein [uncultured Alistipes sp.]|uniref:hypothetical protein n=1 Tax=uncultured Alistipes sp. TaxID=538949 RepID=UPI002670689D|nr:hypothetical protein [uncultured Alistipes sp.]